MEKKLTKKTLHKVMMRWYHGATTCGSYAMMCMLGYACAMFPALKELYPDVEERKRQLRHMACIITQSFSWELRYWE